MATESKRQNFNVDPEQAAQLEAVRVHLNAPTIKDAVLRASQLVIAIASELKSGKRLVTVDSAGNSTQILIPEFQSTTTGWVYLTDRPHPWRRQLFIKGRKKLMASHVCADMQANQLTVQQTAENWDIPIQAVDEAIRYCCDHSSLIEMEAQEERTRLLASGVDVEATPR